MAITYSHSSRPKTVLRQVKHSTSPRQRACAEITAACEQAGFVQGGACITPIMRGFARPRRSNKPMPQINVQLVADCKAQNPNFDQRTTLPSQASSRKLAAEEMGAGRCG
jgi:hypothetical protein